MNKDNQAKAVLRDLGVAPRKVRLLVDLIRGKKVSDVLVQLQFSKKHAAKPLKKLLESAIANAVHNHDLKRETLVIESAFVDGGPILYRWMPRAFGRAFRIRKRTSHITLVLSGEKGAEKQVPKNSESAEEKDVEKKIDIKKEVKKTTKKTDTKKTQKLTAVTGSKKKPMVRKGQRGS